MRRRPVFRSGRWQIERERCHIAAERPAPTTDPLPISADVPKVMKALGLESAVWLRTLEAEWVALVGPGVARHARPGRYERGRLVVFVDSGVWLNELKRYGQKDLLAALQKRFGAERIKALALQPDPDQVRPGPTSR